MMCLLLLTWHLSCIFSSVLFDMVACYLPFIFESFESLFLHIFCSIIPTTQICFCIFLHVLFNSFSSCFCSWLVFNIFYSHLCQRLLLLLVFLLCLASSFCTFISTPPQLCLTSFLSLSHCCCYQSVTGTPDGADKVWGVNSNIGYASDLFLRTEIFTNISLIVYSF